MSKSKQKSITSDIADTTIDSKKNNIKLESITEASDDSDSTKQFKRLLNLYLENLTKLFLHSG